MPSVGPFTLRKEERLCSRKLIEKLFNGGESKSFSSFPLRVVFLLIERNEQDVPIKMMVSVSKKHFKRAVKRNRIKRQIREAYRLNKSLILDPMAQKAHQQLLLSFIWLSDELYNTSDIKQHTEQLIKRIAEKL